MTKSTKITFKKEDGKTIDTIKDKDLTKSLNKLPSGTRIKIFMQENNFDDQFVGDYITKAPSDEQPNPDCPKGQHWDEQQKKCVDDVVTHDCPQGQHWDDAQQKCVLDDVSHQCPEGQHWDEASQSCVPNTPPPTGDHDEFGTLMLHPVTGNFVNMNVGGDPAGNGQRYNCDHKFKNYMMIGYYKTGKGQVQIEMKTDGPHHSGHTQNIPRNTWVEPDLMLADGLFKISSEHPHPVNHKEGATGIKLGKIDQEWIGYAVVAYQDGQFRHIEQWGAKQPFDANGKPTNNWVKGIDVIDTGQICNIDNDNAGGATRPIPPDNGEVMEAEIRMHKTQANHGQPNGTDMKWCRVYELKTPVV